jgi:ornithine carbamoyltransferase
MSKRDFLQITDFSRKEIEQLFDLAKRMKARGYRETPLAGKTLAMIFAKSSTRTRVSFEVGAYQLGGQALFLSSKDIQIGRGEPIPDTARVLSRYVDGIMIRTFDQADVEELARHASIPVINGLTDISHPCQALADVMTIREQLGRIEGARVAYLGDGNNVCASLMVACAKLGASFVAASPEGYEAWPEAVELAREAGGEVELTHDPREAARGADVLYTDVWTSMGQDEERERRLADLAGFGIDDALLQLGTERAIVLHCLPAHYDEEITKEVLYGPRSAAWDQAENRLHAQKALMALVIR